MEVLHSLTNITLERNKNVFIFALLVFLVSPQLSLPFIFYGIYKNEKGAYFLLALFLGIMTYILRPNWNLDISGYYYIYHQFSEMQFSNFIEFIKEKNDFLFYCIYYIPARIGIKFQCLLLAISTTLFYTSFKIYRKIIEKQNLSKNSQFLFFILFLLSLPILGLLSTTRFSLGYTFFLIFIYRRFEEKNLSSYWFLALACVTHFSFLLYVPILLLLPYFRNRRVIFLLILTLYVFVTLVPFRKLVVWASYLSSGLSKKMLIYTDIYADTSIPLLSITLLTPIAIAVFFMLSYYKNIPKQVFSLFSGALLVVLLSVPFNIVIYTRFIGIFKPLFVLSIILTFGNVMRTHFKKQLLILMSVVLYFPFFGYYIYTFYAAYKSSLLDFFLLKKMFLVSILDTTYKFSDFL